MFTQYIGAVTGEVRGALGVAFEFWYFRVKPRVNRSRCMAQVEKRLDYADYIISVVVHLDLFISNQINSSSRLRSMHIAQIVLVRFRSLYKYNGRWG